MEYSKWNDPKTYARVTQELLDLPVPTKPAFVVHPGEKLVHTCLGYHRIDPEHLKNQADELDMVILELTALGKYLTSLQIFELVKLRGYDISRPRLRNRINQLMKKRMLLEGELIKPGAVNLMKFYELDYFGYQLVRDSGIIFHKGNMFISYRKRVENGIPEADPAAIKRVLMGNQILIGLLLSRVRMERFGIMETMRPATTEKIEERYLIRPTLHVRIDQDSVLSYDVVRDIPDAYTWILGKVGRYYELIQNKEYLQKNYHGDTSYPQYVICGESLEHNQKIAAFLKEHEMWKEEDPILFTEDLLNIHHSQVSIYRLHADGSRSWYALPVYGAGKNRTA